MTTIEEKIAKKFIEEELHFSFNIAETKRMANFILSCGDLRQKLTNNN